MLIFQKFVELFSTELYDTGYYDVVKESSLASAEDYAEARVALSFINGYAQACRLANTSTAIIESEFAVAAERSAAIAHEMATGCAILEIMLAQGRSETEIQKAIDRMREHLKSAMNK